LARILESAAGEAGGGLGKGFSRGATRRGGSALPGGRGSPPQGGGAGTRPAGKAGGSPRARAGGAGQGRRPGAGCRPQAGGVRGGVVRVLKSDGVAAAQAAVQSLVTTYGSGAPGLEELASIFNGASKEAADAFSREAEPCINQIASPLGSTMRAAARCLVTAAG